MKENGTFLFPFQISYCNTNFKIKSNTEVKVFTIFTHNGLKSNFACDRHYLLSIIS